MPNGWKTLLPKEIRSAIDALLGASGKSDAGLRRSVFERTRTGAGELASPSGATYLRALVEKIEQRPWTVTGEDFDRLRRAGYSEDHLFELTVAAATGAGVRRFQAGLRALAADDPGEGA